MKHIRYIILIATSLILLVTSCKNEKQDNSPEIITQPKSEVDVEAIKEQIKKEFQDSLDAVEAKRISDESSQKSAAPVKSSNPPTIKKVKSPSKPKPTPKIPEPKKEVSKVQEQEQKLIEKFGGEHDSKQHETKVKEQEKKLMDKFGN